MNILVTGSKGQLGNELQKIAANNKHHQWFFTDVEELNICDLQAIDKYVYFNQIDICINCAAYTAVERAEEEVEKAHLINAVAVDYLAKVSQKYNAILVQISTDYVFDGSGNRPYIETDPICPVSVYGRTKAEGEEMVKASGCNYIIIRTAWLYSAFGNNFVKTMLRLGKEKEKINVVNDQIGSPTWAFDLATMIMTLVNQNGKKAIHELFHFSNEGVISWFDFATAIMEIGKRNCKVLPIATKDYPVKVARPVYSVLDKTKIKQYTNTSIHNWRDSLEDCIREMGNTI